MRLISVAVHGLKDVSDERAVSSTTGCGAASCVGPHVINLTGEKCSEAISAVTGSTRSIAISAEHYLHGTPKKWLQTSVLGETISPVRLFLASVQLESTACGVNPQMTISGVATLPIAPLTTPAVSTSITTLGVEPRRTTVRSTLQGTLRGKSVSNITDYAVVGLEQLVDGSVSRNGLAERARLQ